MELVDAMRTQHACRYYRPDPVPEDVFYKAVEAARFGPQGGNRQPVRFLVVTDEDKKRQLGEWYLVPWKQYYNAVAEGDQAISAGERDREGDLDRDVESAEGTVRRRSVRRALRRSIRRSWSSALTSVTLIRRTPISIG